MEGTVEGIAFGGNGILRSAGKVTFVPYSLPGEIVSYFIEKEKKSFSQGKLLKIMEPSPERTLPHCPYYGECGGCQLQHASSQLQNRSKAQFIQDSLERIAALQLPSPVTVQSSRDEWGYRRKISLQVLPFDGGFQACYNSSDGKYPIPIRECVIFEKNAGEVLQALQDLLSRLASRGRDSARAVLLKEDSGAYFLKIHFKGQFPPRLREEVEVFLQQNSQFTGFAAKAPGKSLQLGKKGLFLAKVAGRNFSYSPDAFVQAHPEQSEAIYRRILECLPPTGKEVLDLYSGVGITSCLLGLNGHETLGIEYNSQAVSMAQDNARALGLQHSAFLEGKVEDLLPEVLENRDYETCVLNPPREGLAKGLPEILNNSTVKNIIYISCLPSTLARDLRVLKENFDLVKALGFDLFPQTTHVESMVLLERNKV